MNCTHVLYQEDWKSFHYHITKQSILPETFLKTEPDGIFYGKDFNTNVIKNLKITPLYAAHSEDDYLNHRRCPVRLKPLDNDVAFGSNGSTPSQDNIEPESFRVWSDEYTCLGYVRKYTVPGKGECLYAPERKEITFFPNKGFKGLLEVMYDIKGKPPYEDEKYRSSIATITIDINDNQP